MGRLTKFYERYEVIMQSDLLEFDRNTALAGLMTDMEREFVIPVHPAQQNKAWEQKNKPVIALYRIISESRGMSN